MNPRYVSYHAISRYCQRLQIRCRKLALFSILEILRDAQEIWQTDEYEYRDMLNGRLPARYFRGFGLVIVVSMAGEVLTVLHDQPGRWKTARSLDQLELLVAKR